MSSTMKPLFLAGALALALAGCGDREARRQAEIQAQAQAKADAQEQAAAQLAQEYDKALKAQDWERARLHGAALLSQYPETPTAEKLRTGYEEVKAKAEALNEERRLAGLWSYAQVHAAGGTQRSASIYSHESVDVDGSGANPVQLVFRDHPQWKRSSYLVLKAGDFRCASGCKVKVIADGAAAKSMEAWRPDTDEAIAMFINDQKALWRLLRKSRMVEIEFPVKAGGTRTAMFETAGLDGAQMPGWD